MALEGVEVSDPEVVLVALHRFETTTLDWVDCLLLSYVPDIPVYTFDEAMIRAGGRSPSDL